MTKKEYSNMFQGIGSLSWSSELAKQGKCAALVRSRTQPFCRRRDVEAAVDLDFFLNRYIPEKLYAGEDPRWFSPPRDASEHETSRRPDRPSDRPSPRFQERCPGHKYRFERESRYNRGSRCDARFVPGAHDFRHSL